MPVPCVPPLAAVTRLSQVDTQLINIPFEKLQIRSGGYGILDVVFLADGKSAWAVCARHVRTCAPCMYTRMCILDVVFPADGKSAGAVRACSTSPPHVARRV